MQMTVLTPRICALVPHSTRPFWHQWESSTQQQQPQPEQQQEQPKKSARRRLFQQEDSADEETNKQYVKRLLNDLSERYKQKWNFDFENDKPMEGQYQYDALPARQVPGFYRMVQHFDQPQSPARPNFFGSATAEQQQQQPSAERNENHWSPLLEQQAGNSSDLGDQPMEAGESKLTASALKSPSRVLRKARRSMQTPNKRNGQQAEDRGRGSHGWPAERQTKLTDFMSTRKGLARSVSKEFKEPQQQPMAVADSPTKRRRHSTLENGSRSPSRLFSSAVDSPIKKGGQTRRSPRLHHARSALFK